MVYSAFSTKLQIGGELVVRSDNDIRVTNINIKETTNGAYETYNNKYTKDTTSMFVTLPSNSSITYEVEITNKDSYGYIVNEIETLSNTNSNIDIDIELKENDLIDSNSIKTFTITFANNTDTEQGNTLVLKYSFAKNSFIVTFDTDGGSIDTLTKEVAYGSTYGELPIPTKEGYTFKGWNGKNLLNVVDRTIQSAGEYAQTSIRTFSGNGIYIGLTSNNYYYPSSISSYSFDEDGNITLYSTSSGYGIVYDVFVKPNTTYRVSAKEIIGNGFFRYGLYNSNGEIISYDATVIIKTSSDTAILTIVTDPGEKTTSTFNSIQLEEGSVATEYEPYYVTSDVKVTQMKDHTLKAIWEKN